MFDPSPLDQCSDATREKYDRAKWAYDVARADYLEAWQAVLREAHAKNQMDDARSDVEGISADTR